MEDGESDIGGSGSGYSGGYEGLGIGNPGSYGGTNDLSRERDTSSNVSQFDQGGFGGLGIGNPGSYGGSNTLGQQDVGGGVSYSQEAMSSALAAADKQMADHNMEYGLATNPALDSFDVATAMDNYTQELVGPEAVDKMVDQNRENDFKTLSSEEKKMARDAADEVDMDMSYMTAAQKEAVGESIINFIGKLTGGTVGGIVGSTTGLAPVTAALGAKFGGQLGTRTMAAEDTEETKAGFGLIDRVTGSNSGALSKEDTDSLVDHLTKWKPLSK